MVSRKSIVRIFRVTKDQITTQLQRIRPGLDATLLTTLEKLPGEDLWRFTFSNPFQPSGQIEARSEIYLEVDTDFLIENLLSIIDSSIKKEDISSISIATDDPTKVDVVLKRDSTRG